MCKVLSTSKSGFYHWMKRQRQGLRPFERVLLFRILEAFEMSNRTYGYRRIYRKLRSWGVLCYKNQIARLMRENGIKAKSKRKFRHTTDSVHKLKISPNLLQRKFKVDQLNKVWVGDITYIWTREGWLYLATTIDLCSKRVVGYSLGKRITKGLVIKAMENALKSRSPQPGLIFHSDRGSQYASDEFREVLKRNKVVQSMSRKGDCWDNAVAESFFKTIKTELIYHYNFKRREEAELRIFEYIEMFYNKNRLHSSINYMSPAEFESKILS